MNSRNLSYKVIHTFAPKLSHSVDWLSQQPFQPPSSWRAWKAKTTRVLSMNEAIDTNENLHKIWEYKWSRGQFPAHLVSFGKQGHRSFFCRNIPASWCWYAGVAAAGPGVDSWFWLFNPWLMGNGCLLRCFLGVKRPLQQWPWQQEQVLDLGCYLQHALLNSDLLCQL